LNEGQPAVESITTAMWYRIDLTRVCNNCSTICTHTWL